MASKKKRNPGAGGAGARKSDQLATAITSEFIPPHHALQVQHLAARFGLTLATAATIAILAFETVGRRA
jgi:hypothetical protein